jgi:hypothetical protein
MPRKPSIRRGSIIGQRAARRSSRGIEGKRLTYRPIDPKGEEGPLVS